MPLSGILQYMMLPGICVLSGGVPLRESFISTGPLYSIINSNKAINFDRMVNSGTGVFKSAVNYIYAEGCMNGITDPVLHIYCHCLVAKWLEPW